MDFSYSDVTLRMGSRPHLIHYDDGRKQWEKLLMFNPSPNVMFYEQYVDGDENSFQAACERLYRRIKQVENGD